MIWIHLWPFLAVALNVWLSRIPHFEADHWPYMAIFGLIYCGVNYVATQIRGTPVYPFMTWRDWISYAVAVAILGFGIGAYIGICRLVNKMKGVGHETKRD